MGSLRMQSAQSAVGRPAVPVGSIAVPAPRAAVPVGSPAAGSSAPRLGFRWGRTVRRCLRLGPAAGAQSLRSPGQAPLARTHGCGGRS